MFLFRKFLLLFILIGSLTPFTVFGMCPQAFSEFRIDELNLSETSLHFLHRAGIHTTANLTRMTKIELLKQLPNFGEGVVREVERALAKRILRLAFDPNDPSIDLNILDLPVEIRRSLYNDGIHYIEDLTLKTRRELRQLPHIGKKSLRQIETALAGRGLSLPNFKGLSLSRGVAVTLHRAQIYDIEMLTRTTQRELKELPDFGEKALREVERALAKQGLQLTFDPKDPLINVNLLDLSYDMRKKLYHSGIHTIEDLTSKTAWELMYLSRFAKIHFFDFRDRGREYLPRRKAINEITAALSKKDLNLASTPPDLSIHVDSLFFYSHDLKNAGIHTIGDLTSKTVEEIMQIPFFKRAHLKRVQEMLSDGGLQLAAPTNPSSVYSLGFSVRVRNAFDSAGIHTIEDLTLKTAVDLMSLDNFRRKQLKEVREVLSENGLKLTPVPFDPLISVDSLSLSPRIKILFNEAGIHTIGDLTSRTVDELMMVLPNFEMTHLKQLRAALNERDLQLAAAPPFGY